MCLAILFFIFLCAAFMWRYLDRDNSTKNSEFHVGLFIGLDMAMTIMLFFYSLVGGQMPSAQDVVDGKTTFKVTYVDNVPTDSIVVLKKEYRHINWW